jgi:hypothetical protein
MPKAATDLDNPVEAGQDDIRFSWQLRHVKPVPEAH